MALRFWVPGGTGNWNDTSNWSVSSGGASGASVPGSADGPRFDALSGSGTVTLDINADVQNLVFTGFTGTFNFGTNTISLNSTGTIFTGATTMTVTGTPLIICTNNSATSRTINPTAVTEANSISFRVTAGTGTLTFGTSAIRDIDFTDGTNPTGFSGSLSTFVVTIYGSLKASTGMTVTSSANIMTFAATSGTKTIDTAGVTFDRPFTFNGVGGTWQLQAALTSGATRTCTLTNGTLDLAGYTLTTGIFNSSVSNTRTLAFGSGNITLTYAASGAGNSQAIWDTTTVTNMTITGTPVVNCTGSPNFPTSTRQLIVGAHGESQSISFNITPTTTATDIVRLATNNAAFKNVIFSSAFTGTIQISNGIFIYGDLDVGGTTAYTFTASSALITFGATSGTQNLDFRSLAVGTAAISSTFIFGTTSSTATTYVLTSGFTALSTATVPITLTAGTLNLNNLTLTATSFSSSNSNTRTLAFGSTGKIVLTGTAATLWTTSTSTNLTVTGTNPLVQLTTNATTGNRGIIFGAAGETNAISLDITAGSDTIGFGTTNGAYKNISAVGFTGTLSYSNSIAVFGNFDAGNATAMAGTAGPNFAATSGTKTIRSNGLAFPTNLTVSGLGGTFTLLDNLTVTNALAHGGGTLNLDSYTATAATLSSSTSNTRTMAFGTGKIVLTGTNATIWTTSISTGLTMTGSRTVEVTGNGLSGETRSISGGQNTAGGTAANAANFYIKAGADIINIGTANRVYGTLDFTGFSGLTFGDVAPQIYGDLVLSSGMTVTGGPNAWIFAATTSQTITTNGKTITNPITFNGVGGTWTLQDALTISSSRVLTLTNGTLSSNGYLISTGDFSSTGTGTRALSLSGGSISLTDTGTVWTTSGTGFSMGSTDKISLSSATAQTLSGGGLSLGTVSIENSAAKTITGNNTFYNIVNTVVPATVNFEAASTNSFSNFNLNGISGSLVSLRSTVSGTQYTLVKI